jgi:tetratricopeptide (TPR) repeat protein
MLVSAAEESFRRGKAALESLRVLEALALFESAIELERRRGKLRVQARYLSFYGLCLALLGHQVREGAEYCREAAAREPYDADLHWNLGVALLRADRRRQAFEALQAGLELEPAHRGIRRELARMGWRRRPVLPFLARSHPLNVLLGRLTRRPMALPAARPP